MEGARFFFLAFLIVSFLFAPACKSIPQKTPEQTLRDRAEVFWRARVEGDEVAQYDFLDPGAKEKWSLQSFIRQTGGISYESFTLEGVKVEGDKGEVQVRVSYTFGRPGTKLTQEMFRSQEWTLVDGVWFWIHPSESLRGKRDQK